MSIPLSATNLPVQHFQVSDRTMYWELTMKKYDHELELLYVIVLDYDSDKTENWQSQSAKNEVSQIHFLHIDWLSFENCLSYYDGQLKHKLPYDGALIDLKPLPKSISLLHRIPIRNLTIGMGHLKYSKKVKWSKNPVEFTLKHPDMIPQLEHVKPYFSKIIGKKTIDVEVTITKVNGQRTIQSVYSKDASQINRNSLYVIKGMQIETFKKTQKTKLKDSILYDPQIVQNDDSIFGNVDSIEKEILFHLLESEEVRNKQQLHYLTDIMDQNRKLMLTIEPQFGFIFTYQGEEMIHFIWELIDTHATYIWSIPSTDWHPSFIKILEQEFAVITPHGRSHYRQHFEARSELYFHTVNHKHSSDPMVDHFGKWRMELDRLMV